MRTQDIEGRSATVATAAVIAIPIIATAAAATIIITRGNAIPIASAASSIRKSYIRHLHLQIATMTNTSPTAPMAEVGVRCREKG
jgi:hypothetical protein